MEGGLSREGVHHIRQQRQRSVVRTMHTVQFLGALLWFHTSHTVWPADSTEVVSTSTRMSLVCRHHIMAGQGKCRRARQLRSVVRKCDQWRGLKHAFRARWRCLSAAHTALCLHFRWKVGGMGLISTNLEELRGQHPSDGARVMQRWVGHLEYYAAATAAAREGRRHSTMGTAGALDQPNQNRERHKSQLTLLTGGVRTLTGVQERVRLPWSSSMASVWLPTCQVGLSKEGQEVRRQLQEGRRVARAHPLQHTGGDQRCVCDLQQ